MSKHRYTTVVCAVIVAVMLVLTILYMISPSLGLKIVRSEPAYVEKLFDVNKVHTIDIVVKESDWDDMLANAMAEEYIQGSVVIDGEAVKGVGIRPKGNSSLSMIASSDSDRYSFKIEFDHYENGKSYFGLDKLALNNIAQDNTYMKDYITYQMMNAMDVDAPLSSFIWVTVNGEDWGLYLAAEAVEESFAQRVYGNNFGEIYKPDSMDMGNMQRNNGGNRGQEGEIPNFGNMPNEGEMPDFGNMPNGGEMPDFGNIPNGEEMPDFGNMPNGGNISDGELPGQGGQMPNFGGAASQTPDNANGQRPNMGGGFGGFGGSATSLIYSDDNIDSYSAIFDNAAFNITEADKERLIQSLKQLNEGRNIEQVVDVDEVIRYFVVHNFVLNSDSYTGNMVHNYYLAENNGKLSMIAWDYNLAFGGMGGFGMGRMPNNNTNTEGNTLGTETTESTSNAATLVNYPIDSPMLSGSTDDKPMIAWIFNNEEYLNQYHEVFEEYMEYFKSGEFAKMYDTAISLITPYVEKDPSAFCTYEEFQKGSSALREFCMLRADSISGQLEGSIASTSEGQTESKNAGFIDASTIDIESMGSNSMGFGGARGGQRVGQFQSSGRGNTENSADGKEIVENNNEKFAQGDKGVPTNGQTDIPAGAFRSQMNGGGQFPDMGTGSGGNSSSSTLSVSDGILFLACIVVLIGAILFAKKR